MPGADKQVTNQTQAATTTPWQPAQPMLQDLLAKYGKQNTDVTGGQEAALAGLNTATAGIPNFGASSSDAIKNLFSSNTTPQVGMLGDAYKTLQGNLGDTAAGKNLDPYATPGFSDAIRTMTDDITKNVKGTYAASGRDPSGAGSFAGSLGRGLTQGIAPVIASQFNTSANRMDAANNALFGAGGSTAAGITGQQQVPLANAAQGVGMLPQAAAAYTLPGATQLGAANAQYQQPWTNLQALLGPLAGIAGLGGQTAGTGTQQTVQPQNLWANILGGGLGTVGMLGMLSDERAKDNIERVGKLDDGQPVFRYNYKGSPVTQIGLLAQRVAETEPDAVGDMGMGMLGVDYRRATDRAARMAA